jgi:hypothetical protein
MSRRIADSGELEFMGRTWHYEGHNDSAGFKVDRLGPVLGRAQLESIRAQMAEQGADTSLIDQVIAAGTPVVATEAL